MGKRKKKAKHNIIGIVYDFDGTLSPNNMQEDTIFKTYRINKKKFWKKADKLVDQGYERTLAYLKLLIHDPIFKRKPLRRKELEQLASHVVYFPGVLNFFENLQKSVDSIPEVREWGIRLEHYVISSGMKEILDGTPIAKYFKRIYACEYDYNRNGAIFPKLVINDTNKIQFLFRINKGKLELDQDINSHMPESQRRIPFNNMIYIGDSFTDIPSMTVIERYGGHAIAVYNRRTRKQEPPEKVKNLVKEKRVSHFAPADYREDSLLTKVLLRTLKYLIHNISHRASSEMSYAWVKRHR